MAIFVGSFYVSARTLRRVTEELFSVHYSNALISLLVSAALVEIATLFGIPLSNIQTLSGGIFGAGLSHRLKFLRLQPFLTIVAGWIVAPLLSFAIGLIL
jgi:PiT family inorganic phosphate transporter